MKDLRTNVIFYLDSPGKAFTHKCNVDLSESRINELFSQAPRLNGAQTNLIKCWQRKRAEQLECTMWNWNRPFFASRLKCLR